MDDKGLVLVTGGAGFIAGYCIRALLERGHRVRATVRSAIRAQHVRAALGGLAEDPERLSFVAADLLKDAGWHAAADNCHYVLHVASPFPATPRNDAQLIGPARDGTVRLLTAARDESVRRVVLTSSMAAIAYGRGGRATPFTEDDWSDETNRRDSTAYERSKTVAERAAWDFMSREGGAMQLTVINPAAVLGPVLGAETSASIELVRMLVSGELPGVPRLNYALVDVRDVAEMHVRAMTEPAAAGQRFIAGGPVMSMADIAGVIRARLPDLSQRVPQRRLPDIAMRVAGVFDGRIRERLFELGVRREVSWAKAERVLGWTPRPVEESIEDTVRSLFDYGIVKR